MHGHSVRVFFPPTKNKKINNISPEFESTYLFLNLGWSCAFLIKQNWRIKMAKRRRKNTIARQEKLEKAGRGTGQGVDFKSYTEVHDISSRGESMRSPSAKFGNDRIDHTLSRLETRVRRYELAPAVIDYRTQVRLNLDETLAIAQLCGFKHPQSNGIPAVMIGDVEIDLLNLDGTIYTKAYTIKPAKDLDKIRVLEKFTIERVYYHIRRIPWGIITPRDIPKVPTENLAFLKPYYNLNDPSLTKKWVLQIADYARPLAQGGELTLKAIGKLCDKQFDLKNGVGLKMLFHMIARGYWRIDFNQPLKATTIIVFTSIPEKLEELMS